VGEDFPVASAGTEAPSPMTALSGGPGRVEARRREEPR
jgi:hypothetical protein